MIDNYLLKKAILRHFFKKTPKAVVNPRSKIAVTLASQNTPASRKLASKITATPKTTVTLASQNTPASRKLASKITATPKTTVTSAQRKVPKAKLIRKSRFPLADEAIQGGARRRYLARLQGKPPEPIIVTHPPGTFPSLSSQKFGSTTYAPPESRKFYK